MKCFHETGLNYFLLDAISHIFIWVLDKFNLHSRYIVVVHTCAVKAHLNYCVPLFTSIVPQAVV